MLSPSEPTQELLRVANDHDSIDGVLPAQIASPSSTFELEETMRDVTRNRTHTVLTGNRTKIDWGLTPSAFELGIEMRRMPKILEHEASDLVVRVSANVTLEELQAQLHQKHQRLAIDTVVRDTTVGGLIATGLSGPLRYGFGSVRDLIIGATVVRPDGVRATTGGRVVKNVAGYDLAKLYTGSYGTLGAITEAFFRLHSLPETAHFLLFEVSLHEIRSLSQEILYSQMAPSALEIRDACDGTGLIFGVLLEGTETSVLERTRSLAMTLAKEPQVLNAAPEWWGVLPDATTFKVTIEVASSQAFLEQLHEIAESNGQRLLVTGSIGTGAMFVGAPLLEQAPEQEIETLTRQIRAAATLAGGSCVVLRAPERVRNLVDVWGPIPALVVMKSIKAQFDPFNLLAPGRFVGGI